MTRLSRALLYTLSIFALSAVDAAANEIFVSKDKRRLEYKAQGVSMVFPIGLGSAPVGEKLKQGDRKTPEGTYFITHKNSKSKFYLSLGISYPNQDDAKTALRFKRISMSEYAAIEKAILNGKLPPQNTPLGGNIFIHGGGAGADWTWGCIALNDEDMKFLFEHLSVGDRVTISK